MSFVDKIGAAFSRNGLIILAGIVLLYCLWIYGLSTNPPGFYIDEACIAYNGYLIGTTGEQEDGTKFPLYIHCYTQGWSQYMSASQPYALAILYAFISPSVISARVFAATLVFIAILLLGLLAARISGRTSIGIIVALSAMATPWLFEFSRLVMETFVLILAIVLFLFSLYNAHKKERWKFTDVLSISLLATLITYSYATGRVIGPLFVFGLLIFAVNLRKLLDVFKVWVIYSITMIPMIMVYLKDPLIISGRFLRATNLSKSASLFENIGTVLVALIQDFSPVFFIIKGDELLRHHVPNAGMGELLVGTFALGILGVIIVLIRHRSSTWWRFILYGAFASMLPGAITFERHHSMRALAFPIFFLLLTVPAISWLMGIYNEKADISDSVESKRASFWSSSTERYIRFGMLGILLLFTAVQTVQFQIVFRKNGIDPSRKTVFHEAYERVLDKALAEGDRPIYLHDSGEPVYMLGLWFGATKGVDRADFVHLLDRQNPPEGALVLTSKSTCTECQVIYQDGGFLLFRNQRPDMSQFGAPVPASPSRAPSVFVGGVGSTSGQFSSPKGLAVDSKGNIYVADTGNSRIQKFDADGRFVIEFGATGPPEMVLKSPNGVAADEDGNIYVVDVGTQKMVKFKADGTFDKVFEGPDTGFYGPRDIAIGSNKQAYIDDQGRSRIVAFDLEKQTYSKIWGSAGSEPSQLSGVTGIAVADDMVFVADLGNGRVQIFDSLGKVIHQWPVAVLTRAADEYPDVAFDENTKTVYVSSSKTNEILAFDLEGNPLVGFKPDGDDKLETPTSITVAEVNKKNWLFVLNTGSSKVSKIALESPKKGK
ncbi:MAG: NHL repeat-containing protein [Chloracidobacterium sp.]|nr:NHL repeat-containing protein [Chloracidobacterium sp.]